jgi:hypothetical protein
MCGLSGVPLRVRLFGATLRSGPPSSGEPPTIRNAEFSDYHVFNLAS